MNRHKKDLPILLHGSECWPVTKRDAHNVDALEYAQ